MDGGDVAATTTTTTETRTNSINALLIPHKVLGQNPSTNPSSNNGQEFFYTNQYQNRTWTRGWGTNCIEWKEE